MKDTILVVLPDGSVHRATLIEPGLEAPIYQLGKKAGTKERKPRTTKTKTAPVADSPAKSAVSNPY
jgi:hypothetical protein